MANKLAGIDVHKKVLMVVVMDAHAPESKPERRRFTTMPSDLRRLSTWLREQGVEEAVMESTAQYWRSVWLELEPHMCLHLAQAFSNRAPRGRKHDFKDAERLARRFIAKELILSFVPDEEQRIWRNLTRMKLQLIRDRVRLHGQIECLLEEMRIKLSVVVTDLLGIERSSHSACFGQWRDRCEEPRVARRPSLEVQRRTADRSADGKIPVHAPADARTRTGATAVAR